MNNIETIKEICKKCGDASCVSLYFLLKEYNQIGEDVSQIKVAEKLNTSLSSVKRWTKRLVDCGFIEVISGEKGRSNKYKFK